MAKLEGVKTVDMVNGEITKVAYDGAEYVKVDEPAIKGDLVVVIKPWATVEVGVYYFVTCAHSEDGYNYVRVSTSTCGYQSDFRAFRKASEPRNDIAGRLTKLEERVDALEPAEEPLRIGDYAKILSGNSVFRAGDIVKLIGDDGSAITFECAFLDGSYAGWKISGDTEMIHATDEEVAEAKAKLAPKFSVGDYAKTLTKSKYFSIDAGEIIVITDIDYTGQIVGERLDNNEKDGIYLPEQLVKATDEEVKFAKIGRKPNEFKKGDIVRVLDRGTSHFNPGEFGVLDEIRDGGARVGGRLTIVNNVRFGGMELITPVEARFDA